MSTDRPGRNNPAVLLAAATSQWAAIRDWFLSSDSKDAGTPAEFDAEQTQILREVADALSYVSDGYQVAKDLEGRGWDADSALVRVMDDVVFAVHDATTSAIRAWVVAQNVQSALVVGTRVSVSPRWQRPFVGEITKIHADRGEYEVYSAELGHVREGVGSHGQLVPYEEVTALGDAVDRLVAVIDGNKIVNVT